VVVAPEEVVVPDSLVEVRERVTEEDVTVATALTYTGALEPDIPSYEIYAELR